MAQSLDVEWVKDFLAVAERGSFTRAAVVRNLNQSSLSRRIQSLETWLGGADLFNRHRSPVALTEAGEEFFPHAARILDAVRKARESVSHGTGSVIPVFSLETLAATFIPRLLSAIRKALHDTSFEIKTSIITGEIADCVEAVAYGTAPFMIVYENGVHPIFLPPGIPRDRWERVVIARDRLIPVCGHESFESYTEALRDGNTRLPYSTYPEGSFLNQLVQEKADDLTFPASDYPDGSRHRKLGEDKERKGDSLTLGDHLELVDFASMADTLRNLVRENQGIAWVLNSTAEHALDKREIEVFDFGRGMESFIDLEIVMFRGRTFSSPTIEPSTLESIWRAAQEVDMTPETPEPSLSSQNGGRP